MFLGLFEMLQSSLEVTWKQKIPALYGPDKISVLFLCLIL